MYILFLCNLFLRTYYHKYNFIGQLICNQVNPNCNQDSKHPLNDSYSIHIGVLKSFWILLSLKKLRPDIESIWVWYRGNNYGGRYQHLKESRNPTYAPCLSQTISFYFVWVVFHFFFHFIICLYLLSLNAFDFFSSFLIPWSSFIILFKILLSIWWLITHYPFFLQFVL